MSKYEHTLKVTLDADLPSSLRVQTSSSPSLELSGNSIGVALSGGGMRAIAAGWGQLRGLMALPSVWARIDALSCVSGGTWCGTIFTFADASIDDESLMGSVVPPDKITQGDGAWTDMSVLPATTIGAAISQLTNAAILETGAAVWWEGFRPDKLFAAILDSLVLSNYRINDPTLDSMLFSWDEASVQAIVANNPGLDPAAFYTARTGRPSFIAGASLVRKETSLLVPVEYTPLWCGVPASSASTEAGVGSGYVQPLGFNTETPTSVSGDLATVALPNYPFQLSDVMASSGAAPGLILDRLGFDYLMPRFEYWCGTGRAHRHSVVDGGLLENTGIVALLRRGFKTVISFVNTEYAFGMPSENYDRQDAYDGIDGQVSRLFGFPTGEDPTSQPVQVFPSAQFEDLANGFQSAYEAGGPITYVDRYRIVEGNPFDIAPYEVTVVWVYNSLNLAWWNALPSAIQDFMTDPDNDFNLTDGTDPRASVNIGSFPNYSFMEQNFPSFLWLTNEQINLLAHHSCYTVTSQIESLLGSG